eukprot:2739603-Rhodomonas_salina.1
MELAIVLFLFFFEWHLGLLTSNVVLATRDLVCGMRDLGGAGLGFGPRDLLLRPRPFRRVGRRPSQCGLPPSVPYLQPT